MPRKVAHHAACRDAAEAALRFNEQYARAAYARVVCRRDARRTAAADDDVVFAFDFRLSLRVRDIHIVHLIVFVMGILYLMEEKVKSVSGKM